MSKRGSRSPSPENEQEHLVKRLRAEKKTTRIVMLGENVNYGRAGSSNNFFYKVLITTEEAINECDCKEIFVNEMECMSIDGTGGSRVDDEMKMDYEKVEKIMAHKDSVVLDSYNLSYCLVGTMCGRSPHIPWRPEPEAEEEAEEEPESD
jgi:hypothetical protein